MSSRRLAVVATGILVAFAAGCGGDFPEHCQNQCQIEERRCSEDGAAVQVCRPDADACLVWVSEDCPGHSECDPLGQPQACHCHAGYAGTDCSRCAPGLHGEQGGCVADDICLAQTCNEHGTCDDSTGAPVCQCDVSHAGDNCEACEIGYHDDGQGTCALDTEQLPTPTGLRSTATTSDSITLEWRYEGPVATFEIERWDGSQWPLVATAEGTRQWTATGLTPGTEYGHRIRATNETGRSVLSNEDWTFTDSGPSAILIADCHDTCRAGSSGTRVVTTSGCAPGGSGECIRMDCANGNCPGSDAWNLQIPNGGEREVTIVWYERFDAWPLTWSGGGCKSVRPFHGGDGYMAGLITFHRSWAQDAIYMSHWDNLTLEPSEMVTRVNTTEQYCTGDSGGVYRCPERFNFEWSTDGGATMGMGTQWRLMRMYIRMPTSFDSGDGRVVLWIDEHLLFNARDVDMDNVGVPKTTSVRFAPVDETATPHGHWYDEITIYRGYVPPP